MIGLTLPVVNDGVGSYRGPFQPSGRMLLGKPVGNCAFGFPICRIAAVNNLVAAVCRQPDSTVFCAGIEEAQTMFRCRRQGFEIGLLGDVPSKV